MSNQFCSTIPINNPCPSFPDTKCVVYTGVILQNLGVNTNDRLQAILQKIDGVIGASVSSSLSTLTDVLLTTPANGDVLTYNSIASKWENLTIPTSITLTTVGTSGAATLLSSVLNIPNYGAALTGYLPLSAGATNPLSGYLYLNDSGINQLGTSAINTFEGVARFDNVLYANSDLSVNGLTNLYGGANISIKLFADNLTQAQIIGTTVTDTTLNSWGLLVGNTFQPTSTLSPDGITQSGLTTMFTFILSSDYITNGNNKNESISAQTLYQDDGTFHTLTGTSSVVKAYSYYSGSSEYTGIMAMIETGVPKSNGAFTGTISKAVGLLISAMSGSDIYSSFSTHYGILQLGVDDRNIFNGIVRCSNQLQVAQEIIIGDADVNTDLNLSNTVSSLFVQLYSTSQAGTTFGLTNQSLAGIFTSSASALVIGTLTPNPLVFGINGIETARFDYSTGNLLIGTTTDNTLGQLLQVNGGIYAQNFVKSGGTSSQILAADGSVITAGTNITISGGVISSTGGGGFSSANYIVDEIPSGIIDGVNDTFTLAHTPITNKQMIFVNGVKMEAGVSSDYTILGATIIFNTGAIPELTDKLSATYIF